MQFELVNNINEFKFLERDWNFIFDKSENLSVFQSFIFNYCSWEEILSKSSSNTLFIIKIIEAQMTVGILPLYIDRKNVLRFINDIHCDFCDIVSNNNIDFTLLFRFIIYECKQTQIRLINLKKVSVLANFGFQNMFPNIIFSVSDNYSDFEVEKGVFPYNYSNLLSRERKEINRIIKKNFDSKYELLNKDICDFPIDDVLNLREKMISCGLRNNDFLKINHIKLIEHLYNNKYIEISRIKDKNIKAILFVIRNHNNMLLWIDLYDNHEYAVALYNCISYIKDKSQNNKICINLGRGIYKWKLLKFKPQIKELYTINIFSNSFIRIIHIIKSYLINIIRLIYIKFKK